MRFIADFGEGKNGLGLGRVPGLKQVNISVLYLCISDYVDISLQLVKRCLSFEKTFRQEGNREGPFSKQ